jgi:hypothetical protein
MQQMFRRRHMTALAAVIGALAIAAPAAQADTATVQAPPSAVQNAWQEGAAAAIGGWQAGAAAAVAGWRAGAVAGLAGWQAGAAAVTNVWQQIASPLVP